jgi:hypothetical protein
MWWRESKKLEFWVHLNKAQDWFGTRGVFRLQVCITFGTFWYCSTFVCIWQILSNYGLTRLKNSSRDVQLNCVISYFFYIHLLLHIYVTKLIWWREYKNLQFESHLNGASGAGRRRTTSKPVVYTVPPVIALAASTERLMATGLTVSGSSGRWLDAGGGRQSTTVSSIYLQWRHAAWPPSTPPPMRRRLPGNSRAGSEPLTASGWAAASFGFQGLMGWACFRSFHNLTYRGTWAGTGTASACMGPKQHSFKSARTVMPAS